MYVYFSIFIAFIVTQRLIELQIAKSNAKYIESKGGFEVGASHYRFIVLLHISFFVLLILEVIGLQKVPPSWWIIPFTIFIFAQVLRVWCMTTLGRFWNTRIYILPGSEPVVKGPYKYLRHPNYVVVAIELLTIPLIFNAYITAIIISLLNAAVLNVRIRTEEQALKHVTAYEKLMSNTPRFHPFSNHKFDKE